jgi:hypothetical protein
VVIFKELGLLPNHAYPAVYSGIYQGHPIIPSHATDGLLCACEHESTCKAIIAVFETHWTVHDLGIMDTFFGFYFVSSSNLS